MVLKKQEFKDDEIPIFDGACVYKSVNYWQCLMWLAKENKYARKSLCTLSETILVERGKAAYLEIYANHQQGKTYKPSYPNPAKTDTIITKKIRCKKHAITIETGIYKMYEVAFKSI